MAVDPETPFNREEMYLAAAAGEGVEVPPCPWSRKEAYLADIGGRIGDAEGDISELNQKVAALATDFSYKGSVADYDHLPSDAAVGDVYTTEDEGYMYVWDGNSWQILNMQGKTTALYMSEFLSNLAGSSTRLTLYHDAAKTQALDRSEITDITNSNSPVFLIASVGSFIDIATVTAFQYDNGELFWTVYASGAAQFFLDFGGDGTTSTASVSSITGGPTVVQTTGTSTTSVMSQNATTGMMYYRYDLNGQNRIRIFGGGNGAIQAPGGTSITIGANDVRAGGNNTIAIGDGAKTYQQYNIAIGANANAEGSGTGHIGNIAIGSSSGSVGTYNVALGYGAGGMANNTKGILWLQKTSSNSTKGYNDTQYMLISGVHDPQTAHDAATKGYVDTLVGDIETALNAINNGGNA